MIRKIFLSALMLVCASAAATAASRPSQEPANPSDANITGHVIDKADGEHIPFCPVKLAGTSITALTDASGHYQFRDLKPGTYTLEVAFIGYQAVRREVTVKAGTTTEVNFEVAPDALMLDQVVVTGSKSETKRRNSPALVSIATSKLLSCVSANSLADGLSFQPGVRVENDCQNCGFTQVRINGLDGHYSQILMNSRPVFSALTGVYGLEQIPANMIDRVEIMRGGGSALFGSSAIGGTVNIITRDPSVNYAEVAHQLTSIGITGSLDNNTTLNASVVNGNNRMGLFIYGQNRNRDGYDHDGDGFTEIAQLKTQTVGVRSFIKPSDLTRLTMEYHGTHEFRRGGDQLDLPAHQAMVAEQVDHNIHGGEASFDLWSAGRYDHLNIFSALQKTKRKSYYGSEMDPNAYGNTHDLVVSAGAQWTHRFDRLWFMPAELIGGLEYNYNYLHDQTVSYNHDVTQKISIYSAYVQNEWRDDRWGFLFGCRIDKNSIIRNPILSPRLNFRFNPSSSLNFRLSYSTGFRSPQAYAEDFHVAVVGGERVVTVLAPDLTHEKSHSISGSADMYFNIGSVQTNFMAEAFYTSLNDVFALRKLDEPDAEGNTVLERYNGSGATVWGFNFEAKAVISSRLDLQAGLTWQKSRYKEPEYWSEDPAVAPVRRMFRTPDLYGYITCNYAFARRWNATLSGTYSGSMLVQHLTGSGTDTDVAETTPDFFDLNFKLTREFRIMHSASIDVSLGINNIFNSYQRRFDQGYLRDSGYIFGPMLPRSLSASVRFHI